MKTLLLIVAMAISVTGCRKKQPAAAVPESQSVTVRTLDAQALSVVEKIRELEFTKDVTCWTSFRQLDQFIATKSYSEFATLAKIVAQKAMVEAVWTKASSGAGGVVTAEDIKRAIELRDVKMSDEERRKLETYASELGMKEFEDYRKTGEHYRVVLAVTYDAIAYDYKVKPLSAEAETALADVAMQLSLELLRDSGKIATELRSPFIEGSHVQTASAGLMQAYSLQNQPSSTKLEAARVKRLQAVTQKLIEAKVAALEHFNAEDPRSPAKAANTLDAINLISPKPVTAKGLERLILDLRSFARFAAGGIEPMRSDNFLGDGQFARAKVPRRLYVDVVWMDNVINQIFPHFVMPNGDIKLRLEPNPGTFASDDREPRDILLLDHQQNAVRDSAIHWEILRGEFERRPFVIDPFAAEILSEVLSMVLTHYLWEAARIADAEGKPAIDEVVAAKLRDPTYVMVTPEHESAATWTAADEAAKTAALAGLPKALFVDVSRKAGFTMGLLEELGQGAVKSNIQRVMGSGMAVGDPNKDGKPDVFIAGEGQARLYLNKGGLRFEDATEAWGIELGMYDSRSALFVDYDADGDDDLFVVRSGHPSILYANEGGAKFRPVTQEAGLTTADGAHVVTAFDYDGDGDLDFYVGYYGSAEVNREKSGANRNLPAIDGRNGTPNQLWRQDAGTFQDVGAEVGVADVGWTLAVAAFDFDADGDQDLYLANDFGRNALLRNDAGKFSDVAGETHTADRGSGMNVSLTDVNGDQLVDWYVTNIDMFSKNIKVIFPTSERTTVNVDESLQKAFQYIAGNKLYVTSKTDQGIAITSEELQRFEPGDRGWGWDASFFDADLDGDEDVYVANGWIEGSYANNQRNQFFVNDGGRFFLADPEGAHAFAGNSRAMTAVDFDGDGDEDVLVTNFRQIPRLLENRQAGGKFAKVRLNAANRAGAVVRLTAGGKTQSRWVTLGRGYLSQDDAEEVFGLGDATTWKATVRWPDGKTTSVGGVAGDTAEATP